MDARPPKIVLDRVSIAFGAFAAVKDVSLAVGEHELVCIVGRSGGGKTSLLRAVGGLIPPCSGRVLLDSTEVRRPTPRIATVFQHFGLFPWKTVRANVEYGLSVQGRRDSGGTVDRLLGVMGLADHATKYPYQLSGGMQQRVGIARALAVEPEVLLLDEPFSALDALTRETLQSELLTLWDRDQETTAATAVLVTHDIDEAILLGDRIVILDGPPGHIVRELRVPIERPRIPREIRFHPEYARLRLDVWEALQGRKEETLVRGGRREGP